MLVLYQCVHFLTSRHRIFLDWPCSARPLTSVRAPLRPSVGDPAPAPARQRRHLCAHARTRAALPTAKAVQTRRGQPGLLPSRTAGARAAAARGCNIGRRCCGRCSRAVRTAARRPRWTELPSGRVLVFQLRQTFALNVTVSRGWKAALQMRGRRWVLGQAKGSSTRA